MMCRKEWNASQVGLHREEDIWYSTLRLFGIYVTKVHALIALFDISFKLVKALQTFWKSNPCVLILPMGDIGMVTLKIQWKPQAFLLRKIYIVQSCTWDLGSSWTSGGPELRGVFVNNYWPLVLSISWFPIVFKIFSLGTTLTQD